MAAAKQHCVSAIFGTNATVSELDRSFKTALRTKGAPPAGSRGQLSNVDREMLNLVQIGHTSVRRIDAEIQNLQQRRAELLELLKP